MRNFLLRTQAIWYPDAYHGWGIQKRFFEGWYIKVVSADERHAIAFIPGISMPENASAQAFIQVMNGKQQVSEFHTFPPEQFLPTTRRFQVSLADNHFSLAGLTIQLPNYQGTLYFDNPHPWPKMLGAPGIMGWYSFVPFMECFHGVVSMNHTLRGQLRIAGESVDFTGGKGYIEKDWGRSFPKAYVWMQSNHFDSAPNASLMASVAHIPWLGSHFIGFISGFLLDGRLFRFATYTGARQYLSLGQEQAELIFRSPKTELRILAQQAPGVALCAPISGAMTGKINESLGATLQVELLEHGKRLFEGKSRTSGLEIAGETNLLL